MNTDQHDPEIFEDHPTTAGFEKQKLVTSEDLRGQNNSSPMGRGSYKGLQSDSDFTTSNLVSSGKQTSEIDQSEF